MRLEQVLAVLVKMGHSTSMNNEDMEKIVNMCVNNIVRKLWILHILVLSKRLNLFCKYLGELERVDKYLARFAALAWSYDSGCFHLVHDFSCTVVAN